MIAVLSAGDQDAAGDRTHQLTEAAAVFEVPAVPREDAQTTANLINRPNDWHATFPSTEDKS